MGAVETSALLPHLYVCITDAAEPDNPRMAELAETVPPVRRSGQVEVYRADRPLVVDVFVPGGRGGSGDADQVPMLVAR